MSYVSGMQSYESVATLGMNASIKSSNKALGLANQQTLTAGSLIDSASRQVSTNNANIAAAKGVGRVLDVVG